MSQLIEREPNAVQTTEKVLLRAQDIQKAFRSGDSLVHILRGTDFAINEGEFVAIEGRSGSGKSTLLHILGALESVDAGSTEYDGVHYAANNTGDFSWWNVSQWSIGGWMKCEAAGLIISIATATFSFSWPFANHLGMLVCRCIGLALVTFCTIALVVSSIAYEQRERPRARIRNERFGFVFQFYHLLPELNALQNAMLAASIKHSVFGFLSQRTEIETRATDLLTQLGMAHRLYHKPSQLSGGERQRVAIARALMNSPKILFADEPTGNLDAETGRQIMDVLEALHRDHGQTIVMVTHDRSLAREADRVLVLREGKLQPAV